jgi:outer membrane receptor protein involved in Fe transport
LSRLDIQRGGANSIGDVLQALPMNAGSPLNTNVNTGGTEPFLEGNQGDGSTRIALRGHSTLVLLNGRRFPNGGLGADASVDLNTVPIAFIDRVEVLASGASAVYGADAVGGVVNIVTRREANGLELGGSRTITGDGDGEIVTGQVGIGFDLLDGAWNLGIDYVKQDGVTLDRRSYSAVPLVIVDGDGTLGFVGNFATPQGYFGVPDGNSLGLEPGAYTRVEGATGQTAADYRPFDWDGDRFNYAPFHFSQTPNERRSLWLLGSQPLGEHLNFFMEGLVHHRESTQASAPEPYHTVFTAPTLADGSWGIPADNYYNPFGVDLPACCPLVARRFVELGNRSFSDDVELWRVLVGLEGTVADWSWTLSAGDAESDASTVETGILFPSRLVQALGPSGRDDAGHIVCGPPDPATGRVPAAGIVPDCVPLNLFGGPGSVTQDQLDYVSLGMTHVGTNEQWIAELVLRGPWGQRNGRDLQWVVGADYRREAGSLTLDPLRILEFGETNVASGAYDAKGLFAEVQVPLLHDRPWVRDIVLNLGARWSDFSTFDQNLSWQAGLRWQPVEELTLRANYADVFRAPTLAELHDPLVRLEGWFDVDPCGNDPTPEQRANCAANGVPGGAYVQGTEGFVVIAGGNPDLGPETGHSFGAGLVYTPGWAAGLSASIDYFQVELSRHIWQDFPDQVLSQCADSGLRDACDAIRRFPDGRLEQVETVTRNFGALRTRGVDFTIDWSAAGEFGDVHSNLLVTYLERWDEQPYSGGEVFHYAGTFPGSAFPRWRALGSVDWQFGPWRAGYAAEYIGSYAQLVEPTPFGTPFAPFNWQVESVLYHDLEGQYEFDSGVSVRAAVTNVTNEDPPFVNLASAANTDAGTYRLLGRTYFLELRYAFGQERS